MGALRTLLIIVTLKCACAACTENDENCQANYDGDESELAQINKVSKILPKVGPRGVPGDACSLGQFCANGPCQIPCPASLQCTQPKCTPGPYCACGQNGETKACPEDGLCPR